MSRIERKVRSLVRSDAEMKPVIQTVLERAENGNGEVQWIDVRDDLTSGQWGRLMEKNILVDGETGFRIEDPEAVRAGLAEKSDDDEEIEESTWSKWDKGAAVVTMLFFAGYAWQPAREVIGGAVDIVLGPIETILPFYVVVMIIALATGLYSTLLRVAIMDMDKMAEYREKMQEMSERRKEAKEAGDEAALEAIQEEQMENMGDQLGMFKEQFRPMVWIMFLTIPAFLWMYWRIGIGDPTNDGIGQTIIIPLAGDVSWTTGVLGPIQVWIVWYFLCSMAFNQIIQKGLNISMTPSSS